MKEPDKKIWKLHVNKYIDDYMPEKWKNIVPKVLKYRDPDFINAFDYQMHLTSEVFVAAFFAKPGSHEYLVADYRERVTKTIYSNSFKTLERVEDVCKCKLKLLKIIFVRRTTGENKAQIVLN